MKQILLIICIAIICACSTSTNRLINQEKLTFNYTDDAYIFFRNIRQSNYDLEIVEEADWRIYRHEDRQQDKKETSVFNTATVVNWRANKAYAILEIDKNVHKENLSITWTDPENQQQGEIILAELQRRQELAFLTEIYNHLIQEHELSWSPGSQKQMPLFHNNDQKEAFRVSMYDYYRLTGVL